VDVAEWERLGLYDPAQPGAPHQLALLEFLAARGADAEDLLDFRDALPGLAAVLALRGGRALTLREVVDESGLGEAEVAAIVRAAGLPIPGPEDRFFVEGFAGLGRGLAAADDLFGSDAVLQLVRVTGTAMARVADAVVSAFLVYVQPQAEREEAVGLASARANEQAVELIPSLMGLLEVLLRQHVIAARRSIAVEQVASGYEVQHLCVGFVDLVDSTALAQTSTVGQLGALLSEFEAMATERVLDGGGRVVKLIGDEVLFTAPTVERGGAIATALAAALAAHPGLPEARCGLAVGDVTLKGGDVFGPVVNLAARVVREAARGRSWWRHPGSTWPRGAQGSSNPRAHGSSRALPIPFRSIGWLAEPAATFGAERPLW
jgi:adenylate cyclase